MAMGRRRPLALGRVPAVGGLPMPTYCDPLLKGVGGTPPRPTLAKSIAVYSDVTDETGISDSKP